MQCTQPQRHSLSIAILVGLMGFSSLPVLAQDAAKTADKKTEPKTLDALVVTAQKREEVMQNVPIAVTALSQQTLQDTGVRDIKDLQILVPGLTVTSTQSEAITTARLRGIGTVGAVSYTHLDVYKRQIITCPVAIRMIQLMMTLHFGSTWSLSGFPLV